MMDGVAHLSARYIERAGEPAIFVRALRPPAPIARLLFVHASTVHSEYYLPLALQLARHGVETWLPDLRGHGHSAGVRGHTQAWSDPVRDVLAGWAAMQSSPAACDLVGGESYGALLAYAAARSGLISPDGAVFLSPAFGLQYRPSPALYRILTRWVWPVAGRLRPLRPLPVAGVTNDPGVRSVIERDRLCNRRYTLGFLLHLLQAQGALDRPDPRWRLPTLALLSTSDPITDNAATCAVFEGNPHVSLRWHDGALHSLVADQPDWTVWMIAQWVVQRAGARSLQQGERG